MKLFDVPSVLKNGITNGSDETFTMIEGMTIRVQFNKDMDVTAITVNGQRIENPTSIRIEDNKLKVDTDKAPEVKAPEVKVPEPKSGLSLDDVASEFKSGINKIGMDGKPSEYFSIIGTTMIRLGYNQESRIVEYIEIDGQIIEKPTAITLVDGKINVKVAETIQPDDNGPRL